MATDVHKQFVADVDAVVDGAAPAGDVAASHQAGLQIQSLKDTISLTADIKLFFFCE